MKIEGHSITVGDLLDFIEKHKIPREGKVLFQRIEDVYFEKHNWTTIDMPGDIYYSAKKFTDKAISGEFNNKEEYPNMDQDTIDKYIEMEKELDSFKEQYIIASSPVKHDNENLYIDAHY